MEASLSELYSRLTDQLEEREHSSDNSGDNSPSSTNFNSSSSSPKRSRRAIQKRVVTVPIKDLEGSRFKGDCTPPSDSWAWRKYGQKPIKGSPYPRGYYRCSSSKGCPARKQVERSHSDPKMLVVTYSYEHNHPLPTSRNHHQNRHALAASSSSSTLTISTAVPAQHSTPSTIKPIKVTNPKLEKNTYDNNSHVHDNDINTHNDNQTTLLQRNNNMDYHQQPLVAPTDELTWLSSDNNSFLDNNSFFNNTNFNDLDMSKIFPLREDDEAFFADLGELPECSVVFRKATAGATAEEQQQCNLAPWCGTTG